MDTNTVPTQDGGSTRDAANLPPGTDVKKLVEDTISNDKLLLANIGFRLADTHPYSGPRDSNWL